MTKITVKYAFWMTDRRAVHSYHSPQTLRIISCHTEHARQASVKQYFCIPTLFLIFFFKDMHDVTLEGPYIIFSLDIMLNIMIFHKALKSYGKYLVLMHRKHFVDWCMQMQMLLKCNMPGLCFGNNLSLNHLRESTAIPTSCWAIKSKQQH